MEHDIDPDNNFFLNINNDNKCCYYTDDQYNRDITSKGKLSIIHFNSRSMYANFNNIKEYVNTFTQPFNIIAISETWINTDKGIDFELNGYELRYNNRKNKGGGGVAIYVDVSLNFRVLDCMTTVVDNLLECITIEICKEKHKNVIISCIYRAPGSSIEIFNEWIEGMFSQINSKIVFICGDFNIDLLNPNKHNITEEFVNTMYSMSLIPKIIRPSRITSHCATLIDNIFTNEIENNTISGLLINDISDHLPVFTIYDCNYKNKLDNQTDYKRVKSEESINALKNDLVAQNWEIIHQANDIDCAYENFLRIFRSLYDKNCPIQEYIIQLKYTKCPWITKGLRNACKKKNTLYRDFLRHRTKDAENKYKIYKNKLINIIRTSKKEYYKKILNDNKNNIKGIWNILNSIIRNNPRQISYPKYFIDKDNANYNMDDVANSFNQFFVNVGPELAEKIPDPGTSGEDYSTLLERNPYSMFLKAVEEKEILDIVTKFKNKKSTDLNDLDMTLVKKVIEGISKPLTFICNLSFQTGKFPNKMKTAKVIPLYKTGNKHHFTNYRPVSLLPQFSKISEKIFNNRLDTFLEKHKLINDSQYGFRTNRSTSLAVIESVEEITNAIEQKKYAVGVFIDIRKAFDTINHDILFDKLERYGIRGIVLDWVKAI